jgi:N-dimethylarginine dimethylaminohydrolase
MCKPRYFDVTYAINPWMAENVHRVSASRANAQWARLQRLVQSVAEVQLIEPEPGLHDMVFTANAGLVMGDQVILSNFRHPERKAEESRFEAWFRKQGFQVHKLPASIFFEGAGDALLDPGRGCIWMGFGHRSAPEASAFIEKILGFEVMPLELIDPRFYHLDTCFCPLSNGHVLFFPEAFSDASRALLATRICHEKSIIAGEDDAVRFACNAVNIGSKIILNDVSDTLANTLANAGFQVDRAPLSEFLKAGGAARCLTLRLEPAA